jgi:hypothetical protein
MKLKFSHPPICYMPGTQKGTPRSSRLGIGQAAGTPSPANKPPHVISITLAKLRSPHFPARNNLQFPTSQYVHKNGIFQMERVILFLIQGIPQPEDARMLPAHGARMSMLNTFAGSPILLLPMNPPRYNDLMVPSVLCILLS